MGRRVCPRGVSQRLGDATGDAGKVLDHRQTAMEQKEEHIGKLEVEVRTTSRLVPTGYPRTTAPA